MQIGKVIGSIVSTQKHESLVGMKLMMIQLVNKDRELIDDFEIAVDIVGAGVGEFVLLTHGSSARHVFGSMDREAVDSAIVGIVDSFES